MTITVKKIAMPEHHSVATEGTKMLENALGLVGHVEIPCIVRIGTLSLTLNELRQLKSDQILPLDQKTHEPVEMMVNNQVIARGELMSCEDYFAIRITDIPS